MLVEGVIRVIVAKLGVVVQVLKMTTVKLHQLPLLLELLKAIVESLTGLILLFFAGTGKPRKREGDWEWPVRTHATFME